MEDRPRARLSVLNVSGDRAADVRESNKVRNMIVEFEQWGRDIVCCSPTSASPSTPTMGQGQLQHVPQSTSQGARAERLGVAHTLEEDEWPEAYHSLDLVPWEGDEAAQRDSGPESAAVPSAVAVETTPEAELESALREGLVHYRENQRGVSYESLFGGYLEGAERVRIVDPYIRAFHQFRNLMEVMEVVLRHVDYTKASPQVHLTTAVDDWNPEKQVEYLQRIKDAVEPQDIDFTWDFSNTIHARHIYVDDRWDIVLDRGLDIWQKFDSNDAFALEGRMPEMRRVKQFEITYRRIG